MKRAIAFILIISTLLFCGCDSLLSEPELSADFEAVLRQDAFPPESTLLNALGEAVKYSKFSEEDDTITFTLSAPDISAPLLEWYESQDSITEEALEQKILELLEGESRSSKFTLSYTRSDSGAIIISYTEEYLSAASCGIRAFYQYLSQKVMTGGAGNE